jgi:hypothetical protein
MISTYTKDFHREMSQIRQISKENISKLPDFNDAFQ